MSEHKASRRTSVLLALLTLIAGAQLTLIVKSASLSANPATITAAETAYAQGTELLASDPPAARAKFRESADGYAAALAQTNGDGAALHFNHANALLRAGSLGASIAEYRAAQLRTPNDARVVANLAEARGQVARSPGVPAPTSLERAASAWNIASEQHRWLATITLLWIACAAALLGPRARGIAIASTLCACLIGGTVLLDALRREQSATAVLTTPTQLRKGNGDGFEPALTEALPEGTECTIRETRAGWLEIELADNTRGWVSEAAVVRVR